jgi:thiamine-phosphate pyrophosphorylase
MREVLGGLYVILDPEVAAGRNLVNIAREAIAGGARIIQWRDKTRPKGLQLTEAEAVLEVCRRAGVPLIINDHCDLALAIESDGVHLGQKDLPVERVSEFARPEWIIGVSTNNAAEARAAEANGADYVSVGRLFATTSKTDTRPATLATLREVKSAVGVPISAIGGINETNIDDVIAAGADMACVISAVVAADDPREAARRLAARFGVARS